MWNLWFMHTDTQKIFDTLWSMAGNDLKCILTCLCCIKYIEINESHTDVQKHISLQKLYE